MVKVVLPPVDTGVVACAVTVKSAACVPVISTTGRAAQIQISDAGIFNGERM